MRRPKLDVSVDPSRAADRAADPAGWRYPDADREVIARVIAERRDIRRFRPDPVPDDVLDRLLDAAHRAPSVGLSQPWRFVVVRSDEVRGQVRALAERERLRQAPRFDERARHFLEQKVEGIIEAPVGLCICCVPPPAEVEVLGRGTIPETDLYSTVCAIQNLWLTARAEGLGVGWVSFYQPPDLRAVLGIPEAVDPVAWLCIGWPDERPVRPGLERAGWAARGRLDEFVYHDRWPAPESPPRPPAAEPAASPVPDAAARTAVRDRADTIVKPIGSLGMLEDVVERWAAATGEPPKGALRAAHLVLAADHGHTRHSTSLYASPVSAQVAAAAARGDTAIAVLARARGERLVVADLGLRGGTPPGCAARPVLPGTADIAAEPAMRREDAIAAIAAGRDLAGELLAETGADCLVVGEIGIGNTTTSAALFCALLDVDARHAVGRGSGLDAQGIVRKRAVVDAAVARHREATPGDDVVDLLAGLGGLEIAGLVGAIEAAHARRVPVLLDGFATCVAALLAVRLAPGCREWLFAGHRSAEPAHTRVLTELGLEPLLDLRLRLGEGSGAALALPLVEAAGRMHREMATFEEAGVDGPSR
ncbi:MAG TPA: nicotinate-nucleotide--dimethylbenzimidazole phosphoribosyltransferase [Solirubrobacteraceae bacterium]|nr:nicotinate-nucleotide--dimethylbenzimidazole phosphoribosyltransferase [Solirubrobacteraceae bacterium]